MSVADHAQQLVTTGNLLLAMPVAATAGFVSFASPCVLPLVPGYLSYVSGVSGQDVEHGGGRQLGRVVAGVALFVLGFRGAVGRFPALRQRFRLFELAGGGMLVLIGLLLVTGLWDSLLNQLRVWAGSVNLPL